jgi:transketolase
MLPGITVMAPGDPLEAMHATRAVVEHAGPCYLRLGKAGEPNVHKGNIDFKIGKALLLRDGRDLTLISTGNLLQTADKVAGQLASNGISTRLISMHTLKPLDDDAVLSAVRETKAIATLEEHSVIGGLGSAVAEVLAEADGARVPFRRIGLPSSFSPHIGSQEYMQEKHGLNVDSLVQALKELLERT